jgi:hypothetical protein
MQNSSLTMANFRLKTKDPLDKTSNDYAVESWPFSLRKTDYQRWRLVNEVSGRQVWKYLSSAQESDAWPQNAPTRYFLGLPTVRIIGMTVVKEHSADNKNLVCALPRYSKDALTCRLQCYMLPQPSTDGTWRQLGNGHWLIATSHSSTSDDLVHH